MTRALYNLVLHLALPLLLLRLWWRGRREPGYRADWTQRFGRYAPVPIPAQPEPAAPKPAAPKPAAPMSAAPIPADLQAASPNSLSAPQDVTARGGTPNPRQPLIWLHAVSLGETLAAQPLVAALRSRYPQHRLLVTHMTATGREAAQRLYGEHARIAFLPYDLPWAVACFFDHFAPALGIVMETEVWPNLAQAAAARGIPMLLANARLSEKSHAGYRRVARLMRPAFGTLAVCAQTAADAARLRDLGATAPVVTGNLKFDTALTEAPAAQVAALRRIIGARPVFLAASTREGEEALLLDALARHPLNRLNLVGQIDSLEPPAELAPSAGIVTVIVPRHPQRFDEVAALLTQRGARFARRSQNAALAADEHLLLGDSMGEMAAYYAVSGCAFIGGSLVPVGGQNMIEAAALGVPALFGPHTFNFAEAAEQAVAAGAAMRVEHADAVWEQVAQLLASPERRRAMGDAGRAFCAAHRGATARTMELVERLLPVAGATG